MNPADRILRGMPRPRVRRPLGARLRAPGHRRRRPVRMLITALVLFAGLRLHLADGDGSGFNGGGSTASATRRR